MIHENLYEPASIAKELNVDVSFVYNARKRISRKLSPYFSLTALMKTDEER